MSTSGHERKRSRKVMEEDVHGFRGGDGGSNPDDVSTSTFLIGVVGCLSGLHMIRRMNFIG
jgi:hypothetical protein